MRVQAARPCPKRMGEAHLRISPNPCSGRSRGRTGKWALAGMMVLSVVAVLACDLVPPKPEAVFTLYRDRMKSGDLEEARNLLSKQSQDLVKALVSQYQLRHPPENLTLLNILDPVTAPVAVKVGQTRALLRVRTLKGGLRLIRLERKTSDAPWSIDLSEELQSFESFLKVRAALETIREQAGEYAATLKAFEDQIRQMKIPDQPEKPQSNE